MPTQRAFTLLELLVVLAIISILIVIGYPTYTQHVLKAQRSEAQIALLDLASAMERYYSLNNTYMGANLSNLEVNQYTSSNDYHLEINNLSDNSYLLKAIPINGQVKDEACGELSVDQTGNRGISGTGSAN